MHEHVRLRLAATGGCISSRELRSLGMEPRGIARLVRSGALVRLRRDALVDGERWRAAAPWERHELRARALWTVVDRPGTPYALSHHSALSLCGARLHGVDDRVHFVRHDGARGRSDTGVQVHAAVPPEWVQGGAVAPVTVRPALAALQVAAAFGVEAGLVAVDGLLHDRTVTETELRQAARAVPPGHARTHLRPVLELADGLSESAGESRLRHLLWALGLPAPVLQAEIRGEGLVARVDMLFDRERVVVEFDGMLKYGVPEDLRAEKRREDALRRLGYEVVRVTWADLGRPEVVAARLRQAFSRATARRAG